MTPQHVRVICRSHNAATPSLETGGYAPTADCVLAVTADAVFDNALQQWRGRSGWCITHRPSGFQLGSVVFDDLDDALAVLERCEPDFPAWKVATGQLGDAATIACAYKFKQACK